MKAARFLALALLCLTSVAYAANIRVQLKANPDGTFTTEYPCLAVDHSDCRPPDAAVLQWGVIPNQNRVSGGSYSVNLRGLYLTGTNAATATITIINCSLPSGWSFATSTLSYSGTGTGSVSTCQAHAEAATETANSNPFIVSAAAPGATDTLAPTIPANCIPVPGINFIELTCDPSTDNHDGTNNGSGVKEYGTSIDGAADAVVSDNGPGIIGASTQYIVGSPTGTCTTSDSAGTVSITCAGTGLDVSPSQFGARGKTVSGDFIATLKVASQTSNGSVFGTAGLMVSADMGATTPYIAYGQSGSASFLVNGTTARERITTGAAKSLICQLTGDGTQRYLRIARTGDTFTFSDSTDNTTYRACGQQIRVLPASLIVGPYLTSMQAGTTDTATFTQWSLSTRASITTHLVTTGSASHTFKRRSRDLAGTPNVSAYTSIITASPIVSATPAKRWNPGIQIELEPWEVLGGSPSWTTTLFDEFQTMNSGGVKANAIVLKVEWGAIETSRGVYDWTKIDNAKAAAAARGFKLAILLAGWAQSKGSINYNSTSVTSGGAGRLPAYLATDSEFTALQQDTTSTACPGETGSHCTKGCYYVSLSTSVVMPRHWVPNCNDRWIAFVAAVGARYDNDSSIEMIRDYTTSILLLPEQWGGDPLFSHGGMTVQLKRTIDAFEAALPHTNFTVGLDYYGSDADVGSLLTYMANHHAMISTTDICIKHEVNLMGTQGQRIYRGAVGGHDYRSTNGGIPGMAAAFEIEGRTMEKPACALSGTDMTTVLTLIQSYAVAYPNYHQVVAYVGNSEATANKPAWTTSVSGTQTIKSFIAGGLVVAGGCPGNYDGGCL